MTLSFWGYYLYHQDYTSCVEAWDKFFCSQDHRRLYIIVVIKHLNIFKELLSVVLRLLHKFFQHEVSLSYLGKLPGVITDS